MKQPDKQKVIEKIALDHLFIESGAGYESLKHTG